jgi:hypothetical protein
MTLGETSDEGPVNGTASPLTLRADGVTWRALDDHIVVLDLDSSLYMSVTGAGAVVWKLLNEGTTLDAMIDAVLEVYEVEPEKARSDLVAFVDDLRVRKLLR